MPAAPPLPKIAEFPLAQTASPPLAQIGVMVSQFPLPSEPEPFAAGSHT